MYRLVSCCGDGDVVDVSSLRGKWCFSRREKAEEKEDGDEDAASSSYANLQLCRVVLVVRSPYKLQPIQKYCTVQYLRL